MAKEIRRKVLGIPVQKSIGSKEDGFLLIRGYFTSDHKDELGDIISRSATERAIPKYRQWGNIRYMHLPKPVGKVVRMGVQDGLEWNEVEIKVVDPQAIFEVENGLLQALSVGILIKYEDIDFLEDGGWLINDYELAEISLVDHPANYDAHLNLDITGSDEFREQAREIGVVPALRSLGITNVGDKNMARKKAVTEEVIVEEKDITQVDTEVAQEAQVEEPVGEEKGIEAAFEAPQAEEQAPEVESEAEVEKSLEEDEEVEEVIEEAVQEESPSELPDFLTVIASLSQIAEKLNQALEKMSAVEEAPEAAEKSIDEAVEEVEEVVVEDTATLLKRIKQLEEKVTDLEKPVSRKGFVPVEDAPDRDVIKQDEASEIEKVAEEKALDLRAAITKYLETKNI